MASLQRVEVRDRFAPAQPTVLADVATVLSCKSEEPRPGMQHLTVEMPLSDPARVHCRKRRVLRRVMTDGTWREYRIVSFRETTGGEGARLEVTAVDPILDLADADLLREVSPSGIVAFDLGMIQASASEAIDTLIISRMPAEYSYFGTGTVEPTTLHDFDLQSDTPLSALEKIVAIVAPAEYRVRQTASVFLIDVLTEIGGDGPVVDVRSRKNLLGLLLTDDAAQMATVVVGFGTDDGSGSVGTLARAAWKLDNPNGDTWEITDPEGGPSPILEDGQLEGYYVVPNTLSDPAVEILNTQVGNPALITLASSTGLVAGGVYELRADASGTLVSEINSPSRSAADSPDGYGRKMASVAREVFCARNHVPNAFFSQWTDPLSAPDGWSRIAGGGSSQAQNTDPLFTEYGGKSWTLVPGPGTTTTVTSPIFFPRAVAGANTFSVVLHLFLEIFSGDASIELTLVPGVVTSVIARNKIVPEDFPAATNSTKAPAGDYYDIGIENIPLSVVPASGLKLQVALTTQPVVGGGQPGTIKAHLDAVSFTQAPKVPPILYEFSSANLLHHACNAALSLNRDGMISHELDVIDVTRLDGTAFPHGTLVTGGYIRVTDEDGSTAGAVLRVIAQPTIDWLVEGETSLVLKSRQQILSDVLGIGTGGGSGVALIASAGGGGVTPPPTPDPEPDDAGYRLEGHVQMLSDTVIVTDSFPPESASATTLTDGSDSNGGAATMATSATSGNVAFRRTTAALFRRDWKTSFHARIRTPATLTNIGIFAGFSATAISSIGTGSDPGAHSALFRYHTAADGTAFWRTVSKDATTLETKTSTVTVAANTVYDVRVDLDLTQALFYINDALVATHSVRLPDLSTRMGMGVAVAAQSAAIRELTVYHYGFTLDAVAVPASEAELTVSSNLTFNATEGGVDPPSKFFTLGNNTPTKQLAGPTLNVVGSPAWLAGLTNGDISGSGNAYTCTVQPTLGALTAAGSPYVATVEFSDANSPNSPVARTVTFNVAVASATLTTVTLTRIDGGSTTVRTRAGFPVKSGWLLPSESAYVRLNDTTTGLDIPIWCAVLGGVHGDGTATFVSIEYDHQSAWGATRACTLIFGEARDTGTDLTPTWDSDPWDTTLFPKDLNTSAWKTSTFPPSMINADKTYLSTTHFWCLNDPWDLRYEGQSGGPAWQQAWFDDWKGSNNTWWNAWVSFTIPPQGIMSFARTQYDFPAHTFMLWCATGDAEYYKRACATLIEWRNRYFRANPKDGVNGGNISIWEHCPWGLAFHYGLTGDPSSQADIGAEAYKHGDPAAIAASVDDYESEPRPLTFTTYGLCAAKRIGATCPSGTWDQRINATLAKWLTTAAAHPGWITSGTWTGAFWNRIMYQGCAMLAGTPPATELVQNFMNALLAIACKQVIEFGDGTHDAIAGTRMDGLCDYLLNTQSGLNVNGVMAHHYNNQNGCGQQGHTLVNQVDINGLFGAAFAIAGEHLGDATYTAHAKVLMETTTFTPNSGNNGPNIYGNPRTMNETFHRAFEGMSKAY